MRRAASKTVLKHELQSVVNIRFTPGSINVQANMVVRNHPSNTDATFKNRLNEGIAQTDLKGIILSPAKVGSKLTLELSIN